MLYSWDIIKKVTYEQVSKEELGGATVHAAKTGIADLVFNNEIEALLQIRKFMQFIPSNYIYKCMY
ncbi:propionyl-CoA carboxylase [Ehrlichia ruminantium]|uniref:Propionyl-CoA carboxylase beta chain n=1 Tax=Ehrlichia ruminantium (strain Welgevonden) TaxID=254945 RepID=A0A0H3LZC5_EHRRW|nr:propionyl-CoA carboxylase [Ehrlichia ruminantium]QLK56041.1 propionyl-CoA carboxylase [Ehrlichia ruminantium]UOD99254.1 propionyl-CoA carboxylase [Ehrlichia ruminantium]CAI26963.1 Propionyl-CoA carboxylase beta chain [Ehrlichia ruminantium str. Welgevonden]